MKIQPMDLSMGEMDVSMGEMDVSMGEMDVSMEKSIYSRQNEGDLCEYSIQWKAYLTFKKRGWKLWRIH
jgi:hypothetical protein